MIFISYFFYIILSFTLVFIFKFSPPTENNFYKLKLVCKKKFLKVLTEELIKQSISNHFFHPNSTP